MKKILVTAFEPFGGSARNSSLDTLNALPDVIGGAAVEKLVLPVEYVRAGDIVAERIREGEAPAAVVSLGQAEGRAAVTPEFIAVNIMNGAIPDNAGRLAVFEPIDENGPDGIRTTLPAAAVVKRLKERGIPAAVSFTAGTYICNSVMYAALRAAKPVGIPAGFIHLPLSDEIADAEGKRGKVPSLPQAKLTEAVTEALQIVLA